MSVDRSPPATDGASASVSTNVNEGKSTSPQERGTHMEGAINVMGESGVDGQSVDTMLNRITLSQTHPPQSTSTNTPSTTAPTSRSSGQKHSPRRRKQTEQDVADGEEDEEEEHDHVLGGQTTVSEDGALPPGVTLRIPLPMAARNMIRRMSSQETGERSSASHIHKKQRQSLLTSPPAQTTPATIDVHSLQRQSSKPLLDTPDSAGSSSSNGVVRCEPCNKLLSSVAQLLDHQQGRRHQLAVQILASGGSLRCGICDKTFNSTHDQSKHMESQGHRANVAQLQTSNMMMSPTPMSTTASVASGASSPFTVHGANHPYMMQMPSSMPSSNVTSPAHPPHTAGQRALMHFCPLCRLRFTDHATLAAHYAGRRHSVAVADAQAEANRLATQQAASLQISQQQAVSQMQHQQQQQQQAFMSHHWQQHQPISMQMGMGMPPYGAPNMYHPQQQPMLGPHNNNPFARMQQQQQQPFQFAPMQHMQPTPQQFAMPFQSYSQLPQMQQHVTPMFPPGFKRVHSNSIHEAEEDDDANSVPHVHNGNVAEPVDGMDEDSIAAGLRGDDESVTAAEMREKLEPQQSQEQRQPSPATNEPPAAGAIETTAAPSATVAPTAAPLQQALPPLLADDPPNSSRKRKYYGRHSPIVVSPMPLGGGMRLMRHQQIGSGADGFMQQHPQMQPYGDMMNMQQIPSQFQSQYPQPMPSLPFSYPSHPHMPGLSPESFPLAGPNFEQTGMISGASSSNGSVTDSDCTTAIAPHPDCRAAHYIFVPYVVRVPTGASTTIDPTLIALDGQFQAAAAQQPAPSYDSYQQHPPKRRMNGPTSSLASSSLSRPNNA